MPLRIAKDSELSVHQQLRQQIIFQISTGELPIGHVMRSLRQLERDLKISRNTVDRVYDELVAQRWLYKQKNRRLVVAYPRLPSPVRAGDTVESLIDRLLLAAQAQGITLDQVAAQMKVRAAAEPPDHFLVVEPEPGIGAVLKYEVHKATGRRVVSYPIPTLISRPELLARAAVLVPAYLADLLDFVPVMQRATMTVLVYSPFGGHIEGVRTLAKPSIIGMISVSGPGMKTMDGVFAEAISSRHQLIPFFVEWPPRNPTKVVIKKLTRKELPPDIDVRRIALESLASGNVAGLGSSSTRSWHADLPLATKADLHAVDVLFCDSITSNYVQHPACLNYRLLSDESLQKIAAVSLAAS